MTERKELSHEVRLLLAFLLSILVVGVWSYFYRPPPPKPAAEKAAPQQPGTQPPPPGGAGTSSPATSQSTQMTAPAAPTVVPVVQGAQEQTIVVENGNYRVEFSNRGAVVRSWQLLKYKDGSDPPKVLDVVNPVAAQQLGAWPLSAAVADGELNQKLNSALYEVTTAGNALKAPAEVEFRWSDGQTSVTKRFRFDESYVVEVESSVERAGQPLAHSLTWRGGFGDHPVRDHEQRVRVLYRTAGTMHALDYNKVGQKDHHEQWFQQPETMDYAGIEDPYFAAVFLPDRAGSAAPAASAQGLQLWHWKVDREATERKNKPTVPVVEIAVGPATAGRLKARLFVGPKDLDILAQQRPPMTEIVDFGWDWLEPISKLLFALLKWSYKYVPNYGWAIVLMTVVINTLLFPLKVKSWRQMQKMQKLMPEMQQIRQRYAKYKFNDPRKQQEQQELMALYKKHGMNPLGLGGCLPMALQMPIWFALYQMLGAAIELRHAPWIFWIRDLSAADPYYVLPILMAVSMYVSQKMTPATAPDPAQQRMMNMLPLVLGFTFVIFPVSSGLVIYIMTSMFVGIAQQWYLNKTNPLRKPADDHGRKGKK